MKLIVCTCSCPSLLIAETGLLEEANCQSITSTSEIRWPDFLCYPARLLSKTDSTVLLIPVDILASFFLIYSRESG
jgi:hypothetical protein